VRMQGNVIGRWTWCKYCVHTYGNGKWYLLKLFQEEGEVEKREQWKGELSYDIFDILWEFYKCHNVLSAQQYLK
jgi:hypothetical protein